MSTTYDQWFKEQLDVFGAWQWNDTKVDAVLIEANTNDDVIKEQIIDFFAAIDAPHFKSGNVAKMFENGFDTIHSIIRADEMDFIVAMGKNGSKAYEGIHHKLQNIYVHDFIGALPFFGRGIGSRKFKKLFETIEWQTLFFTTDITVERIADVEGFDVISAEKILGGRDFFLEFWNIVDSKVRFVEPKVFSTKLNESVFCFTGFRSKLLEETIVANGGKMASGVSKKTTYVVTADPNGTSTKLKKARDLGIPIISQSDLEEMLSTQ